MAAVPATFQSMTVASSPLAGRPDGGSCGRTHESRFFAVILVPLNVLPTRPVESTGVGGATRSPSGTRSGCRVSKTRHRDHIPET